MEYKIQKSDDLYLIGLNSEMSLIKNKTLELWQTFMPRQKEIAKRLGTEYYSVEVFADLEYFKEFNPNRKFEKWAAVRVENFNTIPEGMSKLKISSSLYAVFTYLGKASDAFKAYQYIYEEWIPSSDYELENKAHFAIMGKKYLGENPYSEEEIWIPVKKG
tara:strand:- start:2145 stop:2627 length:483 start_codon:yes stop_codon:yes gene_type:complete